MTTSFLEALKAKSLQEQNNLVQNQQAIAPIILPYIPSNPAPAPKLIITVDRVLNRNRLDVFFSEKPSNDILQSLRDRGFHYRPSDRAWYHKDSEDNRLFLESKFGASFMLSGDVEDNENYEVSDNAMLDNVVVPDNSVTLTSVNNAKDEADPASVFEQYKKQVKDLCEALKIDPADLALLAISKLHDQTFN